MRLYLSPFVTIIEPVVFHPEKRKCLRCGEEFLAKKAWAKYCPHNRCRQKAYFERNFRRVEK